MQSRKFFNFGADFNFLTSSVFVVNFQIPGESLPPTGEAFRITDIGDFRITDSGDRRITD